LTRADLEKLDLFKEKKIRNLLDAIKKSKSRSLARLIFSLGIRHVGEKAAFVLAKEFKSLDKLLKAKKDDLEIIPEIGPVIAESAINYFAQKQTRDMIKGLKKAGLRFKEEGLPLSKGPLNGKSVVFTGELSGCSRHEAEALVRKLGGVSSSSVSRSTDYLVAGNKPGSKYDKARKLGVKIINENIFKEMLK
jgi:DNA ligase (NAD+)